MKDGLQVQADQVVEALKVSGDKKAGAEQIKALYETFVKSDCTMVEVRRPRIAASPVLKFYLPCQPSILPTLTGQ